MKFQYLYFFALMLLFSCDNDDKDNKFLSLYNQMEGKYQLMEVYTDQPVDLNFDSVYNTDMMLEMECQVFYPLNFYQASVSYYENTDNLELMFEMPNSEVYSEEYPESQCFFNDILLYSKVIIDYDTHIITPVISALPDREEEYGNLIGGTYANNTLTLDINKILFTSNGWETIPLHIVYKWRYP